MIIDPNYSEWARRRIAELTAENAALLQASRENADWCKQAIERAERAESQLAKLGGGILIDPRFLDVLGEQDDLKAQLAELSKSPEVDDWETLVKLAYADDGDGALRINRITAEYNRVRNALAEARKVLARIPCQREHTRASPFDCYYYRESTMPGWCEPCKARGPYMAVAQPGAEPAAPLPADSSSAPIAHPDSYDGEEDVPCERHDWDTT